MSKANIAYHNIRPMVTSIQFHDISPSWYLNDAEPPASFQNRFSSFRKDWPVSRLQQVPNEASPCVPTSACEEGVRGRGVPFGSTCQTSQSAGCHYMGLELRIPSCLDPQKDSKYPFIQRDELPSSVMWRLPWGACKFQSHFILQLR